MLLFIIYFTEKICHHWRHIQSTPLYSLCFLFCHCTLCKALVMFFFYQALVMSFLYWIKHFILSSPKWAYYHLIAYYQQAFLKHFTVFLIIIFTSKNKCSVYQHIRIDYFRVRAWGTPLIFNRNSSSTGIDAYDERHSY